MLYVFQHIMMELFKQKDRPDLVPALPIAAALTERCGYYAAGFSIDNPVIIDKGLMYSEASRLATFESWPHTNYQ